MAAKPIVCAEFGPSAYGFPASVILYQTGIDRFAVRYGLQVKAGLDYAEAAAEFGECVMHCAACDDTLDNRSRFEAQSDRTVRAHSLRRLQPNEAVPS